MSVIPGIGVGVGVAAGVFAAAHLHAMFDVRSRMFRGTMCRLPRASANSIALTFDDGPHPEATPAILDQLGEAGVHATFFAIGANIAACPHVVRRVVDEGHEIGNHTWSHRYDGVMRGQKFWRRELEDTSRAIFDACGATTSWFRPPIGHRNFRQQRAVRRSGHRTLGWSLRTLDGIRADDGPILARLNAKLRSRDIVLMHDGRDGRSERDWRVTPRLLSGLLLMLADRDLNVVALPDANPEGTRAHGEQ